MSVSKKANLNYRRILLKLSGESLGGENKIGLDAKVLDNIVTDIKELNQLGVEIAVVVGAGNIFRGKVAQDLGLERFVGDNMGMLGTVINSLALQNVLANNKVPSKVMSALEMKEVAEPYYIPKALDYLIDNQVVIVAGGTGHPFFTTDTAASLRGIELKANILLKATRVDGVFTSDPEKDKSATKIDSISFLDVIKQELRIMDLTAISLCREYNLPILVFDLFQDKVLKKIVQGDQIGTKVY